MANGLIDFGITRPNAAMETYQQGQQNQLAQMQLAQAQQGLQDAEAERNAYKGAANLGEVSQRLMQQGLGKQALAVSAAQAKQQADQIALHKDRLALMKAAATRAMADPANAESILMDYAKQTGSDVTGELEQLRAKKNDPDAVRLWAASHALEADKLLPKFETRDLGGTVERQGYNPLTGKAIGAADVRNKTATPGERMVDARARENIQIARERLAKDNAHLDPTESAALSKAILDGRIDPYKINGKNAKLMAQTIMTNPDANIKDLGIEAAGATAAEKAISGQSAKMSTAANEADKMIGVVRNLSDRVDRSEFPSLNAIQNAVDKGTGGKDIVQLNTSINALVNSYARAISPTGQPTVSDKNHAREILNSAYSNGQISAILDTMGQEMSIAKTSANETRAQLKADRTGGAKPAESKGGLSAAEQAELDQLRARFNK